MVSKFLLFVGLILFIPVFGYAQSSCGPSLGDLARQHREKQEQKSKAADNSSKVITNEDLKGHPDSATGDTSDEDQPDDDASPSQPSKSADEWKSQIAAKKQNVASLQSQMERLNSSIHFASATCARGCVQYNERQEQKQEQVERMRQQLDQQKKELEDMQEAARKEGYGNSVWEP